MAISHPQALVELCHGFYKANYFPCTYPSCPSANLLAALTSHSSQDLQRALAARLRPGDGTREPILRPAHTHGCRTQFPPPPNEPHRVKQLIVSDAVIYLVYYLDVLAWDRCSGDFGWSFRAILNNLRVYPDIYTVTQKTYPAGPMGQTSTCTVRLSLRLALT